MRLNKAKPAIRITGLRRFAGVNEIKVAWSDIKKALNEALVNGSAQSGSCHAPFVTRLRPRQSVKLRRRSLQRPGADIQVEAAARLHERRPQTDRKVFKEGLAQRGKRSAGPLDD